MTPETVRRKELESLYRTMRSDLAGFIRRRVRDSSATDDLVHEVFLRVHAGRERLRDSARLDAWIYRIARNAIADWHRRQRPAESLDGGLAERIPRPDEEPEELLHRFAPGVRRCVEALPPAYREAILESDLRGVPQKELAARLGLSYSGLKSRVQRARRMIHAMFLDCCRLEFDRRGGVIDYHPRHGACRCDQGK